jgi:hypothetical protein
MKERIEKALEIAMTTVVDGDHHKMWTIDQMVRALTGCPMILRTAVDCNGKDYSYYAQGESDEYEEFVSAAKYGEYGPDTYEWDEGVAP